MADSAAGERCSIELQDPPIAVVEFGRTDWTEEDKEDLKRLVTVWGNKWTVIGKLMGRCDNTCRKMFVRCAVRKLTGRYSTEEGIPWTLVAKEMKNMRQPLDYLRHWPATKRNAVLADANAIKSLDGMILMDSKRVHCKVTGGNGSRSHQSSSSSSNSRRDVKILTRKVNTGDSEIDGDRESDSDSDMGLETLPAKKSHVVGMVLARTSFKYMTHICRDNTLIWLEVLANLADNDTKITWADVDKKLLLKHSYSSKRWRCLSKNLSPTLTFREKIVELQKLVKECVIVKEENPYKNRGKKKFIDENYIDEIGDIDCLRKRKNGRVNISRIKKKSKMIVVDKKNENKKELAMKKIFSLKEFHFNTGKKQNMIEKVFRDWNYAEKILYHEIFFNNNKKQTAIDKVSGYHAFIWRNKSRKKIAIEKVFNDWYYSEKILYKTKKPRKKIIKKEKSKEKKIKEKKVKIKIVKERKLKEKKTTHKVPFVKDTNRQRDERLQKKRNRIESGMSRSKRTGVRDVRGLKRSTSNPLKYVQLKKRNSKKVIADDDISIDFGDSDSDSDSGSNYYDNNYESNIVYRNQYDNENRNDSDSGSDTDNQLGIGHRLRRSALKQPRVSVSYQSLASRQRNEIEEDESHSGSESDPFKSDSDSDEDYQEDRPKVSSVKLALKQPRVSASYQSLASRQRNEIEEDESHSGSAESENDMEIDDSYRDHQMIDEDEEEDDEEEVEVGEELDEVDDIDEVKEEEEEEEEEAFYTSEIAYFTQDHVNITDIDQEWKYEEDEDDFWGTEEVIATEVEVVGHPIYEEQNVKDEEKRSTIKEEVVMNDCRTLRSEPSIPLLPNPDDESSVKEESEINLGDRDMLQETGLSNFELQEKRKRKQERSDRRERKKIRAEIRANLNGSKKMMAYGPLNVFGDLKGQTLIEIDDVCEEKMMNSTSGYANSELIEKLKRKQVRSDARERKKIRADLRLSRIKKD